MGFIQKQISQKLLAIYLIFALLFGQLAAPLSVLAQEATNSAEVSPTPTASVSPIDSSEELATESAQPSAEPVATVTPSPIATQSAAIDDNKTSETTSSAQVNSKKVGEKRENKLLRKVNSSAENKEAYVEGEVLVKFKKDKVNLKSHQNISKIDSLENKYDVEKIDEISDANIVVVESDKTTTQLVAELKKDENVESVTPNYIIQPRGLTNDPDLSKLWGLHNTGQTINGVTSTNDADMDAPEAWDVESASQQDVVVAIIDSGVAYDHPDLAANMWDGSNCKNDAGVAISGGCPNHGWDFENNDNNPYDDHGHGTHIAGIIAASANNGVGISGVSGKNNIKIMALKFGYNHPTLAGEIKAINFAKHNGAKVVNVSFGTYTYIQEEKNAFDSFPGLIVVAAGNDTNNNDTKASYPDGYDNPRIIAVAATDQKDQLAGFSNYGATSVDVGAPGVNIYSTKWGYNLNSLDTQNFENVTVPGIPTNFNKSGDFGTANTSDHGKVLFGDITQPYKHNANNSFFSPKFNLSGKQNVAVRFFTRCDTQYNSEFLFDFMQIGLSKDGNNFHNEGNWDEYWLDLISENPKFTGVGYTESILELSVPAEYLTSDFKYSFRWISDGEFRGDLGMGCFVDDVTVGTYSAGVGGYKFDDGTSYSAPYVVGIAGTILNYKADLTSAQVKDTILNSGDAISALQGKTTSGKRVNLNNALASINTKSNNSNLSLLTISHGHLNPTFSPAVKNYNVTVGSNVTAVDVTPTVADSKAIVGVNGVSVASGTQSQQIVLNVGANTISIVVTAEDGTTSTYTLTVTREADTNAPVITISKTPNKDVANTNYTISVTFDDAVTKKYKVDSGNLADYTSAVTVSSEGLHTFYAEGTDANNNKGTAQISFTIDKTAPVVSGVVDGEIYNRDVTPTFNEGTATLNNVSYISGTVITAENSYVLVVTDNAGNTTTVNFNIDKTVPTLSLVRNPNQEISNTDYTITVNYGADAVVKKYRLDGIESNYTSPVVVSSEGLHAFVATALDAAGNITTAQTSLEIDKVAPTVIGVENGKVYNHDVAPIFEVANASATLNGVLFPSGTVITAEGQYSLIVTDAATNSTTINFTIDKTAPEVTITRNPDLNAANADYTLTVNYGDVSTKEYKLDSGNWAAYTQPVIVTTEGAHTFVAKGSDLAENVTTKQVNFSINKTVPVVVNDSVTTLKNNPITIDSSLLLANDQDSAGDILTVSEYTNAQNGEVQLSGSGVTFISPTDFIGTGSFIYTATDGVNSVSGTVYVVVTPPVNDNQIVIQPVVEVDQDKPEVVVVDTAFDTIVNVPSDVTNAALNLSNITETSGSTKSANINNKITVNTDTSVGNVQIQLPADLTISGSAADWNGNINLPTVLANNTVAPATAAGMVTTTTSVIEIGFGEVKLTFDKAVRLLIPGKAGQLVGYSRGDNFTPITTVCSADALVVEGDCKVNVGSDLVVWTKHFTKFATYTQTSIQQNNSGSGSSSSSGSSNSGSNNAAAARCDDVKPGSAPKLISAVAGNNSVTLTWEKAKDPVTYYLVAYGTKSGEIKYGNPNVGDKNTTSYTVRGLSGGFSYFFKVRAGNNCMPGEFSNELAARPMGEILTGVATEFHEDVLGEKESSDSATPSAEEIKIPEMMKSNPLKMILIILAGLGLLTGIAYYIRRRSTHS